MLVFVGLGLVVVDVIVCLDSRYSGRQQDWVGRWKHSKRNELHAEGLLCGL